MKPRTGVPISIKIVAFIFIAIGMLAFANASLVLYSFVHPGSGALPILAATGALIFCASVVSLGVGLLRLSPRSWSWALAVVWIIMGMAACSVMLISVIPAPSYQWNGAPLKIISTIPGMLLGSVLFAVFYWKYCVLIRSENRRLFYPRED